MRPKLSIPAQIKDMRDAGITFDIMSESDARRYLDTNIYYFWLKAYAKNYEKYVGTDKQGQYINLDFAYLVDLAEIDALLIEIILRMSLTLEYYLKVKLLSDFNASNEDGYEIVQDFLKMQPDLRSKIEEVKSNTSSCNELIDKYKDDWAIWNIVEVISLGRFVDLYSLFYNRNRLKNSCSNILQPFKALRNAVAHNSCLLNRLRHPYSQIISPCYDLRTELMQKAGFSKKSLDNKLSHPVIHSFSVLLLLFSRFVPNPTRERFNNEVKKLFDIRMMQNKQYYTKNSVIESSYDFVKRVVDFYC